MYSEIIKKSAVFSSSDIFQTMNDIKVYKNRIKYMRRIYEKYLNYDFPFEDDKYKHKLFNEQMGHIMACGSFLTFGVLESDNTVGKLVNGSFCRQRICPLCQRRRSLKLFSNIQQILEPVKNKYSYIHMTLTVPSVMPCDIHKAITDLNEASKALFNLPEYKKSFKGIIRSLEVTMNVKEMTMHPHIHCLVLVNKSYFTSRDYIKYDDLRKTWGKLVNVKNPQVHLRKCTDLISALCEVVKYAAKPIDTKSKNPDGLTDYEALLYYMNVASALRNRRLLQLFGVCSELSKAYHIDLNDDEIEPIAPEFSEKHCYTYDEESDNFYSDVERSPSSGPLKETPQYIIERIRKRNEKLRQKKIEINRRNARLALRSLLSMKK